MGPPKFLTLLFQHARRSDPDRPSGISPRRYLRARFVFSVRCLVSRQCHRISPIVSTNDSSVLVSSLLTLSPPAPLPFTRLKSLQGGADTPLAYWILCVRFTPVVHVCYRLLPMGNAVRQRRNTRYGRVVSPYENSVLSPLPTGTFTRQEAPSFAWRTNKRFRLWFALLTQSNLIR
jgi:hypothetical protein